MFNLKYCGNISKNCLSSAPFISRKTLLTSLKPISLCSTRIYREQTGIHSKHLNQFDKGAFKSLKIAPIKAQLTESEEEFLVRIKNDPDSFGDGNQEQIEELDEGDVREEKYFTEQPSPNQKLRTKQYADIIKRFLQQRKIKEAIDVVEIRMLKEDRVKPESYIYNLVLGGCGRVGYTKKAFMLYNNMKKRGLKATAGTYTALFNACSNSPWPTTDGLSRAKHLYDIMIEKGHLPNDTTYNAMIKAFGRGADLTMAFSLVDEMASRGFPIKDDTINFLLQSCISDRETGFRHSLLVWRRVIARGIRPTTYTFNHLLRCARDCGLGDLETTKNVIEKLIGEKVSGQHALQNQSQKLQLEEGFVTNLQGAKSKDVEDNPTFFDEDIISTWDLVEREVPKHQDSVELDEQRDNNLQSLAAEPQNADLRPNLLAEKPHLGSILSISEIQKPEDRLLLLGGCRGFLETMSHYNCTPDIKTFTILLDNIPNTLAAETELISAMKKLKVKPDIDFYNMLIKKRSMRLDYDGAKQVLSLMKFRPNVITYGVLAMGCKTKSKALDLIAQFQKYGYTLNSPILGALMKQACYHMDFDYVFEIMELCLKESVPVDKKFLEHLNTFKRRCRQKLNAKEFDKKQVKSYGIFKERFKNWLTEVQIDDSEDVHPWQQFRQPYEEEVKFHPKDTDRFRARHMSLFKVKTSTKHLKKNR